MLLFIKCIMSLMIGLFLSLIFGLVLVPILKKKKLNQRLSIYLENTHENKKSIPTMGGLIFIIPTIIIIIFFLITKRIEISYNLFICLFTFIGYSIIGFVDDYLIIYKNNNNGLSEPFKLSLQIILAIIIFYFFMKAGNEPLLWIHTLGIKWNIGWLYGIFILLVLISSSNAVNITDGLDGLATGLSIIALSTFGIITTTTGWLTGYEEISIFIFVLVGTLIGFLFFNAHPAKIFMGDTGSLSLGATLGIIAILTRHELLLLVIGFVFVVETMTCVIQRVYFKFTKKRIFPMTPIHHTFEKYLPEREVVKIFWIIGLFTSMISLIFGVWI
jgi:phospho-N-acetylmuramoyl-pentapeptide-transferase